MQQNTVTKLWRLYAASQIKFTNRLKAVVGISWAKLDATGDNYGAELSTHRAKANPYAGLLYDITPILTAYASYTTIFNPQTEQRADHSQLAPVEGTNMEAGLKANLFHRRLYASATVFRTREQGLANYIGYTTDPVYGFFYIYAPENIESKGFEFEVAGHVTKNWALSGGYTKMSLTDETEGGPANTYIPRQTFKASTTYSVPEWRNLSIGTEMRWQDAIATEVTSFTPTTGGQPVLRQPAYALIDLMAGIDVLPRLRATLNVRNITNKLYFTSLAYGNYGQAFYGAGRNVTASLAFRF